MFDTQKEKKKHFESIYKNETMQTKWKKNSNHLYKDKQTFSVHMEYHKSYSLRTCPHGVLESGNFESHLLLTCFLGNSGELSSGHNYFNLHITIILTTTITIEANPAINAALMQS